MLRLNMSACCASFEGDRKHPKKQPCPAHGKACLEVSVRTIIHHLKAPWLWVPRARHYYFCADSACKIAYFGDDDSIILQSELRTHSGLQVPDGEALLCYCFGVSRADFERNPLSRDFVMAQTAAGLCSCATSNPSGRCCLKNFPDVEG